MSIPLATSADAILDATTAGRDLLRAADAPAQRALLGITGTGADGAQGPPGNDGSPGAPGADGADGTDGASAYEVAVANGFVGSESAWLASLVGPQGLQGIPGADGADGAQGLPGNDGSPGAPGADGADGADGVGVPAGGTAGQVLAKVDGTDFNTQWALASPRLTAMKTAAYTAAAWDWVRVNMSGAGGNVQVDLPASPSDGDRVVVTLATKHASYKLVVGRNGSNVNGGTSMSGFDMSTDGGTCVFTYVGGNAGWIGAVAV